MAFKTKIVQVNTASTKVALFSVNTICTWGAVFPHTSNTGIIFVGDGAVTNQAPMTTGHAGMEINAGKYFFDASEININSLSVSNQAVFLYIEAP